MKKRYPKNTEGDFYSTGYQEDNGQWKSNCFWCGTPENEAPELLSPLSDKDENTYFIKQPKTDIEITHAISASEVCCVDAIRYSGKNKSILKRMNPDLCDFKVSIFGAIINNSGKWWKQW